MIDIPTILVTGGAGRLGRALIAAASPSARVIALPRQTLDVTDDISIASAMERVSPHVVINAAAKTHVDDCEAAEASVRDVNTLGAEKIARATFANGAAFIQVSTDYVFGDSGQHPLPEDAPRNPVNAYGRTKAEAESRVLAVDPRAMIVRTAWLFGDLPDDFVGKLLHAAEGRSQLSVVDDQTGSPTPIDAAAAILLSIARRLSHRETLPSILHVAGSPPATRAEWAECVFAARQSTGASHITVDRIASDLYPTPARRPKHTALDVSRLVQVGETPPDWRAATHASVLARRRVIATSSPPGA